MKSLRLSILIVAFSFGVVQISLPMRQIKGAQAQKKIRPRDQLQALLNDSNPSDANWNSDVQRLINVVRKNNPNNPILVQGFQNQYAATMQAYQQAQKPQPIAQKYEQPT